MKLTIVLIVLLLAVAFYACSKKATNTQIKEVDKTTFAKLMAEHPDYKILDVRTPQEQAGGMIAGAKGIDVTAPDFAEKVAKLDKDETYLVYCKSGGRSTRACQIMSEQGFEDIYNLQGGYTAWVKE